MLEKLEQLFLPGYPYSAVKDIVDYCYKTAYQHCRLKGEKLLPLLQKNGLSLRDISYDAIASLFGRNEEGDFVELKRAFTHWQPSISNDAGAAYFLHCLSVRKTEQRITSLYAENDHYFFKILTAVNYLLKKHYAGRLKKVMYLGTVYIVPVEMQGCLSNIIDEQFLAVIPASDISVNCRLFETIFKRIQESQTFSQAIPLNLLIKRLKEAHTPNIVPLRETGRHYSVNEPETDRDLAILMENVVDTARKKVTRTYVEKGKLNQIEGNAFSSIVADIGRDLLDGGPERNLQNYISAHLPDISNDEYKRKYKKVVEYLVRMMRSELLEKLKA